jgi:2'-5' RNA ligase
MSGRGETNEIPIVFQHAGRSPDTPTDHRKDTGRAFVPTNNEPQKKAGRLSGKERGLRLFIAINFDRETRSRLTALRDALRADSTQGRFSAPENLHLTLVFLGECDEKQATAARAAMDAVRFEPFAMGIGRLGRFRREGGDIWWAGVSECQQLAELQKELTKELTERGFRIERRKFSPHITLGREIVTKASPCAIEEFGQRVNKIELIKSERIDGKLTYTAIYETGAGR